VAEIEYFYAAHSAYAYLGSAYLMEIARDANAILVHKPYDLRKGISGVGSVPTGDRPSNHRAYFFGREIKRWSEERNAPVIDGLPTYHHHDIGLVNSMIIAAIEAGNEADQLAHALLTAHWRDDADLADEATLDAIARAVGLDGQTLLAKAKTAEVRAIYDRNTDEAIRRSVFGSPTYFVDGDMFYGQDRLDLVKRALVKPYAGVWPPASS
jgi:2-hydroxychromene-2-carboxylate isomerase